MSALDSPNAAFLHQHTLECGDDSTNPSPAQTAVSARGAPRYTSSQRMAMQSSSRRALPDDNLTNLEDDLDEFLAAMDEDLPQRLAARGKRMSVRSASPTPSLASDFFAAAAAATAAAAVSPSPIPASAVRSAGIGVGVSGVVSAARPHSRVGVALSSSSPPPRHHHHHSSSSTSSGSVSSSTAHNKATSAITTLEEEKATMVKARYAACHLTDEFIDNFRPSVSKEQVAAVCAHFGATGSNQSMALAEARQVAAWLYARIPVMFRAMIARANPSLSQAQCSALVAEHLTHLLPGTSEEIVSYFLTSGLKLQADGRVSRDEFVRAWNRHARTICPNVQQKNTAKGTVLCTIL